MLKTASSGITIAISSLLCGFFAMRAVGSSITELATETGWSYTAFVAQSNEQPRPSEYRKPAQSERDLTADLSPRAIMEVANQVAHWQLNQFDIRSNMMQTERRASGLPEGWIYGALQVGLMAWAKASDQQDILRAVYNMSLLNEWRVGPRPYNADDHVIGDVYLDLYEIYGGDEKISRVRSVFDFILREPSPVELEFDVTEREVLFGAHRQLTDSICKQRWSWADAIFMAPPVWAHLANITENPDYLDFMNREFWETTDYLYDKEEHLYYRDSRYFEQRDENGRPIFWSRGNGWVYAGLARILEHLPEDYADRPRYEELFMDMGKRLRDIQLESGSWRSSLLEKGFSTSRESSGTGLLVYGFAWGINNGLLDSETYGPVVKKGWQSLVGCVAPSGRVGWVQQVAHAPGSATMEDTELYGTGAVLLAASELLKMVQNVSDRATHVHE